MVANGSRRPVEPPDGRARRGDGPAERRSMRREGSACPAGGILVRVESLAAAGAQAAADIPPAIRPGRRSPDQGGRRPALERSLPVAVGVELDLVAHELRRAGRPVHVRPKEFLLLAILAANPGRAFSRRQLLDMAWDPERDVDPRTVDVHVHWLRSKIERTPRRPAHLVTVRGFGYRLDPAAR